MSESQSQSQEQWAMYAEEELGFIFNQNALLTQKFREVLNKIVSGDYPELMKSLDMNGAEATAMGVKINGDANRSFSVYRAVTEAQRSVRAIINGKYKADDSTRDFPSNKRQKNICSIAKNMLDTHAPGWDDTDDEDVDDLDGVIPESAFKQNDDGDDNGDDNGDDGNDDGDDGDDGNDKNGDHRDHKAEESEEDEEDDEDDEYKENSASSSSSDDDDDDGEEGEDGEDCD